MLKLDGRVESAQTIKDLEPGARYALYVGVDNRSDGQARLAVAAVIHAHIEGITCTRFQILYGLC